MRPDAGVPGPAGNQIWSAAYAALAASTLLAFLQQGLLTPTLPLYVSSLGGSALAVGIVLGAFSVLSFLLRPLIGEMTDRSTVVGVFTLGSIGLAVTGAGLLIPVLWVLTVVNAARGLSWAAINTAGNTLLARLAPPSRRAEASAYHSIFQVAPMTAGPALGLWWLGRSGSFAPIFLAAALCGVLTLAVVRRMKVEERPRPRRPIDLRIAAALDRSALLPSGILAIGIATQPAVLAFLPLRVEELGLRAQQLIVFYVAFGACAFVSRLTFGRLGDRMRRDRAILLGLSMLGSGLFIIMLASSLSYIILGGAAYALGQGMIQPSLMALAIDRADPERQGLAMGTYSAAFQLGMGAGSVISGALVDWVGYQAMYGSMVLLIVAAAIWVLMS